MMKLVATVLGATLWFVGIIGIFSHTVLGMILTPVHDIVLIVAGVISMYFGLRGTEFQARYCCRIIGAIFTILGIIGFIVGPGIVTLDGLSYRDSNLLRLPGILLGTADSVFNLIVGIVGLVAGFFPREKEIQIDMKAEQAKQKALSKG